MTRLENKYEPTMVTAIPLLIGDVLFPEDVEERSTITEPHIVIFADSTTNRLFAMSLTGAGKPEQFSYQSIIDDLGSRFISKGKFKVPKHMLLSDSFFSEKELNKRDEKMSIIQPILDVLEEYLLSNSYGKRLITKCFELAKRNGLSIQRTEIYYLLSRYFKAGCRSNAFLRKPGTGKFTNKDHHKKTGPKRGEGKRSNGRMRTEQDNKNIRAILNKHVKTNPSKSLPRSYEILLDKYYSELVFCPDTGSTEYVRMSDEDCISVHQFKGYAKQYMGEHAEEFRIAQGKQDAYRKDVAGLSGTINDFFALGPGHTYQIDETPLDIELVCEFDKTRTKRVGKPTCYSVIDMYSSAWVGLMLTLSSSSAHTACEVMFIAFRDKEKFCKEIGVKLIEPWPMQGKCCTIWVDNAEFASELERAFSRDAQVAQIYNTEGNSQQKGKVERAHKTLEDFLYSMVPGVGRKVIADHLKRNLRKQALLNKRELYQLLIDFVTTYNNHYSNKSMQITKEMHVAGIKKTALDKWNWGLVNRAGYLRSVDERELYLSLLETGFVTVYRDYLFLPGLHFRSNSSGSSPKGMKYICDWTFSNNLQDVKKGRKLPVLSCRFMRHSMDHILIETRDGFKIAILHSSEKLFEHMSCDEVQKEKNKIREKGIVQDSIYSQKNSKIRHKANEMLTEAKEQQVEINQYQANSQDLSANRQVTIDDENKRVANRHCQLLNNEDMPIPIEVSQHSVVGSSLTYLEPKSENKTTSIFRQKRKDLKNQRNQKENK